ncbi:MAG: CHAT domain-containing protein [Nitrospinaceae bacterium]|nr:CHAT domain-containing protein [Nitrospinaceae bacterium]NIR54988.1 CHAT domain-containing protein [Nitrospinaceae bacterium]NIT82228.1 CHAT domain-containing protein [Nitrospinaceae bacterium]NIW06066.1 CHAT domain-containing protein [Nitrospinaceae bacterium]NIX34615.1 CHAT domain-containing protein [Nitrospinaceae bacterium]
MDERQLIADSMSGLDEDLRWIEKSHDSFREALNRAEKIKWPEGSPVISQLRHNRRLAANLLGIAPGEDEVKPPEFLEWQALYLASFQVAGEKRLELLKKSEAMLSGLVLDSPGDSPSLSLMEDLYRALTRLLFERKRYSEALYFSEKGVQQTLMRKLSGLPLKFRDEARAAYYDEIISFRQSRRDWLKQVRDPETGKEVLKSQGDELVREYQDFMGSVAEEDPAFVSLFLPEGVRLEEVQSQLRPGELVLKVSPVSNRILIWAVTAEKVQGYQTDLEGPLLSTLKRLREKPFPLLPEDLAVLSRGLMGPVTEDLKRARSLILVAGGHLEFLPWPALRVDGKMLVERLPVSYQTSLAQYLLSRANRNLYNSRYLAFDYSEENFGRIRKAFISAENYAQERATVDQFQQVFDKYGVWDISGHAALRRLDGSDSYINLTRRRHRFERLSYTDLIGEKQEANFIFLGNVRYEFDPESGVSPSAPLVQALTVTGFPGLVMHTGEADPGYHEAFRVEFFKTFHNAQPAESLRRAQLKMIRRFPRSLAWTRYRFYGYPGMEEQEKARFAEERFMINIRKGIEAVKSKHWLSAINHYEKALALAPFLKDSNASHPLYKGLAQAAFNQGDYPKGIHYQKQALAWAQKGGDPEEMAEAMFMLGILYSRAERYQPAVDYLNRALAFYRENEILDRLAEIYTQLGIVQENALDFGQALQAFSASARVNEEIGEDFYRGQELRRIGRIYYLRLNHYGKAREFYTQAHALFQELGHIEQTIETLMELGLVAEKQGAFEPARGYYRKAQALAETNHLKPQLVKAFFYQGNNSWYQGQYQNAFRFQKQALRIAREIGDKRQQAFIYNTLGLIHWTLNDSVRALENLETSRALAEAVHSPLDVSTAFNNMGLVYRKDKKYEKSIELFQEALKRDTRLKSKWAQGYTHRNLGISYLRLKRLDEAETHFKQAMELSGAINNRINLVKTQLELGHLELARNHCPKAVPIFEETAQRAGRLNIREVLWRALRGQGVCLARQGKVPEAIERYRKAVAVVEEMRAAIKVEEFQNGYLTDKQDVYRELILLLLQMGRVEESFNTAERAKARSFIDLLGNQKISLKNDVSRQLYDRLTAQKQRIRTIEESLKGLSEPEELERAKKELISARIHYRDLLIEAKEQSPEISSFVTVEAITLKKLYGLLEPEVALVEYLVTPRELIAWIVIRDSIRVVRTPLEASRLQAAVKDYRARIQKLAPVEELSRRLYDWVVRPVEKYIAGKRVLGIIPHGILHYLSFASLYDGTSYLVERHPLFYSPSASVLEYTFQRKTDKSGPVKVLALGNPDLGTLNYDLPLAEMEANAIKWNYPEVTVLTREQATESWLQKNIGDYQIIHIASHGEFDAVNPLFSSLKLTKDKEADGNFEVNEVFSLDIQADLVTLSACQTGLGEIVGGDELIGLNRAFIYAGTHALVSSLWRVSDISTAVLIKHFYRNYTVQNKGESLRKAQLLVKKLYPHPSYWAGFNLTGDYR